MEGSPGAGSQNQNRGTNNKQSLDNDFMDMVKQGNSSDSTNYRINISNKIFYSKLGKYEQIINLFKLIGFQKKQSRNYSAFQFVVDPHSTVEMQLIWENLPSNQTEVFLNQMAKK